MEAASEKGRIAGRAGRDERIFLFNFTGILDWFSMEDIYFSEIPLSRER